MMHYSRLLLAHLHLPKLNADCEEYLSKALFVVGEFGGNDYNAPIFSGISLNQVKTYVPEVVKAIGRGINVSLIVSQLLYSKSYFILLLDGTIMGEKS